MPPVRESSWTMSTRLQWRAQASTARAIERRERAQVEHAGLDAVGRQPLRDAQRGVHVGAVRNDRQVVARLVAAPPCRSAAARRRIAAKHLLDARIAVERDVLVVEDRIRIGDGARHQRSRVVRRRGDDDLQARRAIEPRLGVLAVIRAG